MADEQAEQQSPQPVTVIVAANNETTALLYTALTTGLTAHVDEPARSPWGVDTGSWHRDYYFHAANLDQQLHVCASGSHNPSVGITHITCILPGHLDSGVLDAWLKGMGVSPAECGMAYINATWPPEDVPKQMLPIPLQPPYTLTSHSKASWRVDDPEAFALWLIAQGFAEVKAVATHDREWRRFIRGAEVVTISTGFIITGAGRGAAKVRQMLMKMAAAWSYC